MKYIYIIEMTEQNRTADDLAFWRSHGKRFEVQPHDETSPYDSSFVATYAQAVKLAKALKREMGWPDAVISIDA